MPVEGTRFNSANRAKAIYPYVLNVYNDPRFQQVAWTASQAILLCEMEQDHPQRCAQDCDGTRGTANHVDWADACCWQVLMKDAVTRKKIFVIPRADQFDQKWTADVQLNGEHTSRDAYRV